MTLLKQLLLPHHFESRRRRSIWTCTCTNHLVLWYSLATKQQTRKDKSNIRNKMRRIVFTWIIILWVMTESKPFPAVFGFTVRSVMTSSQRNWRMTTPPCNTAVVPIPLWELRLLPQQSFTSLRKMPCIRLFETDSGDTVNNDIQETITPMSTSTLQTLDELDGKALEEMEQEQPSEWMIMQQVRL
jgi:hypothetical protein